MSEKNYHLKYWVELGSWTKKEIQEDYKADSEMGATDAMVLVSILNEAEEKSMVIIHLDGKEERPLNRLELFDVWIALARNILADKSEHDTKDLFPEHLKSLQEVAVKYSGYCERAPKFLEDIQNECNKMRYN